MIGCDIRKLDDEAYKILTNRDAPAINQDGRGAQPYVANNEWMKANHGNTPVAARMMENGDVAVALFSMNDNDAVCDFRSDQIGLPPVTKVRLMVRDA